MAYTDFPTSAEPLLRALRRLNELVDVDPETVDLVEAYARIQIQSGRTVNYFPPLPDQPSTQLVSLLGKNPQLDDESKRFIAAHFSALRRHGLVPVLSKGHLAATLDTPLSDLERLAHRSPNAYRKFYIPKRNGAPRLILSPAPELKTVQRRILDRILRWVPLNKHAEGFRRKRSILTNSAHHLSKAFVVKMDAEDFFPSITSARVRGLFIDLGYPAQVADLMQRLTTYHGGLPIGAPTSPALSNILCRRLDARFANLGVTMDFSYSRYADDLTFSSDHPNFPKLIPLFKEVLTSEGFAVNEDKTRIMRGARRQQVTGIVVNEKPNIARSERQKLRAVIHNCKKNGVAAEAAKWARHEKGLPPTAAYTTAQFKRSLIGRIQHVALINPDAGGKLLASFNAIAWTAA